MSNSPQDMNLRGKLYELEGALRDAGGPQQLRDELLELIDIAYETGQERHMVDEANRLARAVQDYGRDVRRCASNLLDAAAGVDL